MPYSADHIFRGMIRHGHAIDQLSREVYSDTDEENGGLEVVAPEAADFICAFLTINRALAGDHDTRTLREALTKSILDVLEEQAVDLSRAGVLPTIVGKPLL